VAAIIAALLVRKHRVVEKRKQTPKDESPESGAGAADLSLGGVDASPPPPSAAGDKKVHDVHLNPNTLTCTYSLFTHLHLVYLLSSSTEQMELKEIEQTNPLQSQPRHPAATTTADVAALGYLVPQPPSAESLAPAVEIFGDAVINFKEIVMKKQIGHGAFGVSMLQFRYVCVCVCVCVCEYALTQANTSFVVFIFRLFSKLDTTRQT
jgi:hypothetical protein